MGTVERLSQHTRDNTNEDHLKGLLSVPEKEFLSYYQIKKVNK